MRRIQIVRDPAALYHAAARICVDAATSAVAHSGRFAFALSGGSTPGALYSLLATDPAPRATFPWRQTYFFFVDERPVPPGARESNYRTAYEAMLSKAPVAESQVFRIKGELPDVSDAAATYEQSLRDFFRLAPGQLPRFDLLLLGMGPDGHTASLFPHSKALEERTRLVTANWVEKFHQHRITMTAPVLNNAAQVMFMAFGPEKAQALRAVLEGPHDPQQFPSQLVEPRDGSVTWLVDEAAAALLDRAKTGAVPSR